MLKVQEITTQPGKLGRIAMIVFVLIWIGAIIWIFGVLPIKDYGIVEPLLLIPIIVFVGFGILGIRRVLKLFDLFIIGEQLHIIGFSKSAVVSTYEIESYEIGKLTCKLNLKSNSEFGKVIPFSLHAIHYDRAEKVLKRAMNRAKN